MKKNNTESKLRKAAQEQSDLPPNFVWDNIEEELNIKDQKRRIGFWWWGSAILIFTTIITIILVRGNQDQYLHSTNQSYPKSDKTTQNNSNEYVNNDIKNSNTPNLIGTKTIEKTNKLKAANLNNKNTGTLKDQLSKVSKTKDDFENSNNLPNHQNLTITSVDKTYKENSIFNIQEENKTLSINEEMRITNTYHPLASLNINSPTYSRQLLPTQEYSSFENKKYFNPFLEYGIIAGVHALNFSKAQNHNIYNQRKESERSWYSTGIYSQIGMNIFSNWYASIGVEWTMSKSKFENRKNGITKMVVNLDPNTGSAIDTNFISGSILDKGDITLHFIDIPFNLGYTVSNNNWLYGAELSTLINLKTTAEGKLLTGSEIGTLSNGQQDIYKKSVGLGFKGSLLLGRKINEQYILQLRPSYKTYLNPISASNNSLSTRYNLFSLSVGMKRFF